MLNTFPELLSYGLLAPLLIRVLLGIIFIDLGFLKFKGEKTRWIASCEALGIKPADFFVPLYGFLQILGGVLLVFGLWTQLAALMFVIFTGMELYVEWKAREILKRDLVFYLFAFVTSLSLLLSGAGAFAIDLPL